MLKRFQYWVESYFSGLCLLKLKMSFSTASDWWPWYYRIPPGLWFDIAEFSLTFPVSINGEVFSLVLYWTLTLFSISATTFLEDRTRVYKKFLGCSILSWEYPLNLKTGHSECTRNDPITKSKSNLHAKKLEWNNNFWTLNLHNVVLRLHAIFWKWTTLIHCWHTYSGNLSLRNGFSLASPQSQSTYEMFLLLICLMIFWQWHHCISLWPSF